MFCYFIVPYSWVHLNVKKLLQKSDLTFSMFFVWFWAFEWDFMAINCVT
jgi:hypothetical protein